MNDYLNAMNSKLKVTNGDLKTVNKTFSWVLDPAHSELGFKIKHLMISSVSGRFEDFNLHMVTNDIGFSSAKLTLKADIKSVSTDDEKRDAHLLTTEFFKADQFPELFFESTEFENIRRGTFMLHGNLTMRGVTRPVKLKAKLNGIINDPYGQEKAGFTIRGEINRNDWGVSFNSALESGGMVLGDIVQINSELQLIKQVKNETDY